MIKSCNKNVHDKLRNLSFYVEKIEKHTEFNPKLFAGKYNKISFAKWCIQDNLGRKFSKTFS